MKPLDISQNLYARCENRMFVRHYTGLLALYGLAQTAIETQSPRLLNKCISLLSLYPDSFPHPTYNFDAYRTGGNAKAYLLMLDSMKRISIDPDFVKEHKKVVRAAAELTLAAPADRNGILCMPHSPEKEQVWIDVVTAVTPFMLYAGHVFNEPKYQDFAAEQCIKMYELFLDPKCGLLHQSRGFLNDPNAFSDDHWSRGNGWGYVGFADLAAWLPQNSRYRAQVEQQFLEFSSAIQKYQDENGLWRQEMTREDCWEESSGTGLFLYGIGLGLRLGLLPKSRFQATYEKGLVGISRYCIDSDFRTKSSCPGCLCPGQGADKGTIHAYMTVKQPQADEPHSYGAIMLAMAEAHRNGISDLTVGGGLL